MRVNLAEVNWENIMSKEHLESIINARIASGQFDSMADIERRAGMKMDVLRHYFKGRVKSLKTDYSVGLARCLGMSTEELATLMFSKEGAANTEMVSLPCLRIDEMEKRGRRGRGNITIDAAAGLTIPAKANKWILLDDDAMMPTAKKGDAVLMIEDSILKSGGLYFLSGEATPPVFRRVKMRMGDSRIDALADNPDYPSEENIAPKSLKILGRAVAVLKFI